MTTDPVTVEAAKALVRERAFTIGEDYAGTGRTVIHTFAGGFIGCDWDLDDALAFIDGSGARFWARSPFAHELVVDSGGRQVAFDVKRPEAV